MSARSFLTNRLAHLLRRYHRQLPHTKSMWLELMPLDTKETFEGRPLSALTIPYIHGQAGDRRNLLDLWVEPLRTGEWDPVKELGSAASYTLVKFMRVEGVKREVDLFEQTVRLIYVLGKTRGARMTIDETSIMVEHDGLTYGMQDGAIVTRLNAGIEIGKGNPQALLETVDVVEINDMTFSSLYREAYRRGQGVLNLLMALRTGHPDFRFHKLVDSSRAHKYMTRKQMDQAEKVIFEADDPVATLYRKLVPAYTSRTDFIAYISPVGGRQIPPTIYARQRLLNHLVSFFQPPKEDQQ